MNQRIFAQIFVGMFLLVLTMNLASAVLVNADYITVYPGEKGTVSVEVENNENFDIESVSLSLELGDIPFTSVGSSEKDVDDVNEDDSEKVSFALLPFTDVTPGDYDIPYVLTYKNSENTTDTIEKKGTFGIRVGAKTDLDFSLEIRDNAILGQEGRVSLEVINKGLGEVKSVSVKIFPNGFELTSKDKVFIGTISADDTDLASFDVIYRSITPTFSAIVEYKDFDNLDRSKTVTIPFKVYTEEEAIERGLIQKSNTSIYATGIVVLLIIWFVWRTIKKRRKNKARA